MTVRSRWTMLATVLVGVTLATGGCASQQSRSSTPASSSVAVTSSGGTRQPVKFIAEVWVDNWFSLSVNGQVVGEDVEPITQERSFNSQTLEFTATYPLTLAVVSKDYMENRSGLEYIGTSKQ